MGVAQSVTCTGTTMFLHKFLLYVCTAAPLTTSSPQSYFHNFGNQGTYTSVRHGSSSAVHHPPQQPQPYGASSPTVKSFYNAPVAKPAAYHAPLPKPYVQRHHPTTTHTPHHNLMGQVLSMTGRSVLWTMWRRKLRCVCQPLRLTVREKMLRMVWLLNRKRNAIRLPRQCVQRQMRYLTMKCVLTPALSYLWRQRLSWWMLSGRNLVEMIPSVLTLTMLQEVMLPLLTVLRNTDMSAISPLCYTQLLRRWLSSYHSQ